MSEPGLSPDVLAEEPRSRLGLAALVLTPPVAWSLHLLSCYLVVTLDCTTAWNGSGWAITVLTVVGVAAALTAAAIAWRRRAGETDDAHELEPDRRGASSVFLYRLTLAGGLFFSITMILAALAPPFVDLCAMAPANAVVLAAARGRGFSVPAASALRPADRA